MDGTWTALLTVGVLAAVAHAADTVGSPAAVPFHERTLDSFSDETITRAWPSKETENLWYAVLDVGPMRNVSDPDFSTAAKTREEAIAKAARKIRDDARGIGKYAPHAILRPGSYDLRWRLMKHWADKEAKGSAARGTAYSWDEVRKALLAAPNPPTNYGLTYWDVRGIASAFDWNTRWVESGWSPGTKEYENLPAMIRAKPDEFLADISRYYGDDYYLSGPRRQAASGSSAKTDPDIAAAWRAGRSARSPSLWTDGQTIWSYDLAIGETRDGQKVAIDYKVSTTTSKHLSKVKAVADVVVAPQRVLPKNYFRIPRITGPR
jgi:hypothetical protein